MRNKSFLLFLLVVSIALCGKAQNKKIKFHSINSFGFVIGEHGNDIMLQTVNGVTYKNFYSGIGFGIDYYDYNSYPLFFDQRIYFGKKNKAFVYGDLGYNFNAKNKPGKEIYYYNSYHFSGSVYTDIGIGYKMKFSKKSSLMLSAGFSYKEISDKVAIVIPTMVPCPSTGCPVDYQTYKYGNGRVVLKAGVDF